MQATGEKNKFTLKGNLYTLHQGFLFVFFIDSGDWHEAHFESKMF